jgi:hypothetical protein
MQIYTVILDGQMFTPEEQQAVTRETGQLAV